ncbi:DUF3579 domain-containing protein [Thiobacter aerophilum]|uniref:DUF3579 domain-containing protein n=1 Tax=Thiobacter aerophilum TaxID=3121275 RepID=A0ABV0EH49_9BURK
MKISTNDLIIKGVTTSGRKFRPSDWAERLAGALGAFGDDNRVSYSPYVRPVTLEGVGCVVVSRALKEVDPRAYEFLMGFARDNDLTVIDGAVWVTTRGAEAAAGG